MLNMLLKLLAVWGMVDALWITTNPRAWSDFWQGRVSAIGDSQNLSRGMALLQLSFCLWLFNKAR